MSSNFIEVKPWQHADQPLMNLLAERLTSLQMPGEATSVLVFWLKKQDLVAGHRSAILFVDRRCVPAKVQVFYPDCFFPEEVENES